jgi:hypothetical protein
MQPSQTRRLKPRPVSAVNCTASRLSDRYVTNRPMTNRRRPTRVCCVPCACSASGGGLVSRRRARRCARVDLTSPGAGATPSVLVTPRQQATSPHSLFSRRVLLGLAGAVRAYAISRPQGAEASWIPTRTMPGWHSVGICGRGKGPGSAGLAAGRPRGRGTRAASHESARSTAGSTLAPSVAGSRGYGWRSADIASQGRLAQHEAQILWYAGRVARIKEYGPHVARLLSKPAEARLRASGCCRSLVPDRQGDGRRFWLAGGESTQRGRARLSTPSVLFVVCGSWCGQSGRVSQVFCP